MPQSPLPPVLLLLGVPVTAEDVAPPTPELPVLVTGPLPVVVFVGPAVVVPDVLLPLALVAAAAVEPLVALPKPPEVPVIVLLAEPCVVVDP